MFMPLNEVNLLLARRSLLRIGYAILPEVLYDHSSKTKESAQTYWMDQFGNALDYLKEYTLSNYEQPPIQVDASIVVSWELLCIICLPLMGFTGQPLTYDQTFDTEKPF